ncbi:MAG: HD domain-containing protein [Nitrospira sp.]|nr:HD domain-containing protein [Nitrospira sp.]
MSTPTPHGVSLIADPIHHYIHFTVPDPSSDPHEITEKDLIDSPWVQRLRYIYQLQSARWVYPAAEHSRFQHVLGTMHLAGQYAKHVYPSLARTVRDVPTLPYIEALLRVAALLHDVGHGPFCHFFDWHFLHHHGLSHERLGQVIIRDKLGHLIQQLKRSPSGMFATGETINPDHIASLIVKDPHKPNRHSPRWLRLLQPLIGGLFTADNFDYVLRDSYMCGVAVGPVDIPRLMHYTMITPKGLALHKNGLPALQMFLNARLYLYSNVYYHRTSRAIDLHLLEMFRETMEEIFPYNPLHHLEHYRQLTDWSLLETVRTWATSSNRKKRRIGKEWNRLLGRYVKWKTAYSKALTTRDDPLRESEMSPAMLEKHIRQALPRRLKDLTFRVDMASKDTRPLNVLNMGQFQFYLYDPTTQTVEKEKLQELCEFLPSRIVQLRIFAEDHHADQALARATERVLHGER